MLQRTRAVVGVVLAAALAVGFLGVGPVLYKSTIDLDAPSFVAGEAIQAAGDALGIDLGRSVAGPFWALVGMLSVLAGSFLLVRASTRARRAATDPGRRSFLQGTASGAAAALAATGLAGLAAFLRAFRGVGNEGRGWGP